MFHLVELRLKDLKEACRKYSVERLDLFGSAAAGSFRPGSSDLDFVVRFADRSPTGSYAERFLDFADALERIFGCEVHLVTDESIGNPFLRREIENSRETVYERFNQEAPV